MIRNSGTATETRLPRSSRRGRPEFRWLSLFFLALALFVLCGCGSDYKAPELETTGQAASPLGQVIDLEVDLSNLQIPGAVQRGVELELTLHVSRSGYGELAARVETGDARWDNTGGPIDDLSPGTTTVFSAPDTWSTGRIGPLSIDGTTFEMTLSGTTDDGGWTLDGTAWESQSGLPGRFDGWRQQRFLVATTDFFSTGKVVEVAWSKRRHLIVRDELELVSSDPALRVTGGSAFAINRFTFDNLQRLDPERDFSTAWQSGLGSGSNPHDILLLDADKAYVTRYEPPFNDVAVITPRGGTVSQSIALDELAQNVDGTPPRGPAGVCRRRRLRRTAGYRSHLHSLRRGEAGGHRPAARRGRRQHPAGWEEPGAHRRASRRR